MKNLAFRLILPGLIFQAIVIGGGYGTGRELVEFFLIHGPAHGLAAMGVATLIWCSVLAVSFEVARINKAYDYRTFIRSILKRGWVAYEFIYIAFVILVVSVIGAASGEVVADAIGAPKLLGTIASSAVIAFLLYRGTGLVAKYSSIWTTILYVFFFTLVMLCFINFFAEIKINYLSENTASNWFLGGVKYASYNIGFAPAILFCVKKLQTRTETLTAGVLAGVIGMAPGLCIYLSLLSRFPEVLDAPIPVLLVLSSLNIPVFQFLFQIILVGTFIATSVGLIHGVNERLAHSFQEKGRKYSGLQRSLVGVGILIISIVIAEKVGLITLIANGYGLLTWGFLIIFVIPTLSIGVAQILSYRSSST